VHGHGLLAGKIEHLAQGAGNAIALVQDGFDLGQLGALFQDLGAAADDGQGGSQLVGQARGQRTDGGELFCADQLVFQAVQFLRVPEAFAQGQLLFPLAPEKANNDPSRQQESGDRGHHPPALGLAMGL
jgi:hypothetical protein